MPPRLNLLQASRALPIRSRAPIERWRPITITQLYPAQIRSYTDSSKDMPISPNNKGPNQDTPLHVSEEAAAIAKTTGETGPDLEQGTPIEEVVAGDKEAQEKLPKVMKDAIKASKPSSSRSFSTSTRSRQDDMLQMMSDNPQTPAAIVGSGLAPIEKAPTGVKFGLPTLPLPADHNLHHRYDPLIDQLVGLLIRDGKKDVARRVCLLLPDPFTI